MRASPSASKPDIKVVSNGAAGRTDSFAVRSTLVSPMRAVSLTDAAPGGALARRRKVVRPSLPSAMARVSDTAPTPRSRGGSSAVTANSAAVPDPSTLLATPTASSKTSFGATARGRFGVRTTGPANRHRNRLRAEPRIRHAHGHHAQFAVEVIGDGDFDLADLRPGLLDSEPERHGRLGATPEGLRLAPRSLAASPPPGAATRRSTS